MNWISWWRNLPPIERRDYLFQALAVCLVTLGVCLFVLSILQLLNRGG